MDEVDINDNQMHIIPLADQRSWLRFNNFLTPFYSADVRRDDDSVNFH